MVLAVHAVSALQQAARAPISPFVSGSPEQRTRTEASDADTIILVGIGACSGEAIAERLASRLEPLRCPWLRHLL